MIARQGIVFLTIVALFIFSNLVIATNQGFEETNQTTLITKSEQQTSQPAQQTIHKDKKSERPESINQANPIWPIIAESILANWRGVLRT